LLSAAPKEHVTDADDSAIGSDDNDTDVGRGKVKGGGKEDTILAVVEYVSFGGRDSGNSTLFTATVARDGDTEVGDKHDFSGTANDVGDTTNDVGGTTNDVGGTTNDVGGTTNDVGGTTNDVGSTTNDVGGTTNDVGDTTNDVGRDCMDDARENSGDGGGSKKGGRDNEGGGGYRCVNCDDSNKNDGVGGDGGDDGAGDDDKTGDNEGAKDDGGSACATLQSYASVRAGHCCDVDVALGRAEHCTVIADIMGVDVDRKILLRSDEKPELQIFRREPSWVSHGCVPPCPREKKICKLAQNFSDNERDADARVPRLFLSHACLQTFSRAHARVCMCVYVCR
jgi:hypothetical protein